MHSFSSVLIKKEIFASVGVFDQSFHMMADWDFWIRFTRRHSITYMKTPLFFYHIHSCNVSFNNAKMHIKEMTHLPIIVDPSHAIGVRDKIVPLAKASKVVGAHGIMVEFHPDPPSALSDAEQALTFDQYSQMMKELYEL